MSSVQTALDIVFRRKFYQYDFFDGTHRPTWVLRYLATGAMKDNWIKRYESAVSAWMGLPYVFSFASGRMALYAILEAFHIGSGDEVIIPAFTCVVVPNAILYRGAKPVYVDIESDTFNIDPQKIESAITPRTKVILAQHTLGHPCAIDRIMEIARRRNLIVIEDCAHAFGATYRGKILGTFGDACFVSTDHTKVISTSTGGLAATSRSDVAANLQNIQLKAATLSPFVRFRIALQYILLSYLHRPSIYWCGKIFVSLGSRLKLWFYFKDELHETKPALYPARLSNIQGFIGWHEIQRLETNIQHRRSIASAWQELFEGNKSVSTGGAFLRYSVLVRSPQDWQSAFGKYFSIQSRWFTSIAHGRVEGFSKIGYTPGSCPIGEYVSDHIINFPTHFLINDKAITRFRSLLNATKLRHTVVNSFSAHQVPISVGASQ